MTDFRALCAELLAALENAVRVIYHEDGTQHISTAEPVMDRARAALAELDGVGVTEQEWDALKDRLWSHYETAGYQGERFICQADFDTALDVARIELAREGAGVGPTLEQVENLCEEHQFGVEGYESVECLQGLINDAIARYGTHSRPIPVAERLPTEADCDQHGRCWLFDTHDEAWLLDQYGPLSANEFWLPAAAIPLPQQENTDE